MYKLQQVIWSTLTILTLATIELQAGTKINGFSIEDNGIIGCDNIEFQISLNDASWRGFTERKDNSKLEKGSLKITQNQFKTAVKLKFQGKPLVTKTYTALGDNALTCSYDFKAEQKINLKRLALAIRLPAKQFTGRTISFDNKEITFPEKVGKAHFYWPKPCQKITLHSANGSLVFEGNLTTAVLDNRVWKHKSFTLLLLFNPSKGEIVNSKLEFKCFRNNNKLSATEFKQKQLNFTPLDLKAIANRGFKDDVAGDGEGGWSDQGENDLRNFKFTGRTTLANIQFDIINPQQNSGNSCVILGGPFGQKLPRQATFQINNKGAGIYFLHATAWNEPKIGEYIVQYNDGTHQTVPIRNMHEIFDWWHCSESQNAVLGWQGHNAVNFNIGLTIFAWKNPYPEKTIKQITTKMTGKKAMLMVVAASLVDKGPWLVHSDSENKVSTKDWFAFNGIDETKAKHSAIDVSFINHKPSGKYGFVKSQGENFFFANGQKARFWGVNFDRWDCFPTKKYAKYHAERLARMGVNLVRFHKMDTFKSFGVRYFSLFKNKDVTKFNSETLDLFHYFWHQLKKNGIYITVDIKTSRTVSPKENLQEMVNQSFHSYGMFVPQMIEAQKNMATMLLTAKNPYTGMSPVEDPALAMIVITNEDTLFYPPKQGQLTNKYAQKIWQKGFNCYLKEKYKSREDLEKAWIPGSNKKRKGLQVDENPLDGTVKLPFAYKGKGYSLARLTDCRKYVYNLQTDFLKEMDQHLKSLGVKCPITGSNHWTADMIDLYSNAQLDFIDRHEYWAHPTGGWSYNVITFNNTSNLASPIGGMLASINRRRVYGKPYIITEWNDASPNEYRGEAQLLMPAYASLGNWSAVQFCYSPRKSFFEKPSIMRSPLQIANDPVQLCLWPATALMYHRSDISEAQQGFFEVVTPKQVFNPFFSIKKAGLSSAGLKGRSGLMFSDIKENKSLTDPSFIPPADSTKITSITNQLSWDSQKQQFTLNSPNCKGFAGFSNQHPIDCGEVKLTISTDFSTIVMISLDSKPIQNSKRILLTAVSRAWNTDMEYNSLRNRINEVGKLPVLMQPVEGIIEMNTSNKYKAYRLSISGERLAEIPLTQTNTGFKLNLSKDFKTCHYEFVQQ